MLARGVAHIVNYGVGIAHETKQYRKEKAEWKEYQAKNPTEDDAEDDSDHWKLDDAAEDLENEQGDAPPAYEEATMESLVGGVDKLRAGALELTESKNSEPLPFPVILSQRSPRHRSRGFVRAYAPILEAKGISQETFLSFLNTFDKSIRTAVAWDVMNLASNFVGIGAPLAIGIPIGAAMGFIANTGKEMQRRYKTNAYLDKINEELFMPRGLYCMIMTYKPNRKDEKVVRVDFSEAASARAERGEESTKKKGKRFLGTQAGKSEGALSIPEAAPLVYPTLSAAADADDEDAPQAPQFSSYREYISDYLDRRRRAKFAVQNPNDPFAQLPDKAFASKYADPNHQMYHHGPVNMITGGSVDLWKSKREERVERAEKAAGRPLSEAEKLHVMYDRGFTTPAAYVRRIISEDMLYLVICNMPTPEEVAQAKAAEEGANVDGTKMDVDVAKTEKVPEVVSSNIAAESKVVA